MSLQVSKTLAHDGETAPKVPALLLHQFAAALLACIIAAAAFSLYLSFADTVSTSRRQMNAAAYNAQIFFDQREILLRTLSSSAVQNANGSLASKIPRHLGDAQQVEVFPLPENEDTYDWALILTARHLEDIDFFHTQLLYSSVRNKKTLLVVPLQGHDVGDITLAKQQWIAHALATANPHIQSDGQIPIVWLKPPMDKVNQLYLYTPMDQAIPGSGWIGLEVVNIDAAIDLSPLVAGSYALYNQHGTPILHSQDPNFPVHLMGQQDRADSFGWWGAGLLPQFVVLNKSIGEAGWRLVYYTPISEIIRNSAFAIQLTLIITAILVSAVILGVHRIRKKLIIPAIRQYEILADSVSLNQKLVEFAPVGLCLLRCADGVPILSNEVARQWLLGDYDLLARLLSTESLGSGWEHTLPDGRCLYLTFATITYRAQLCVLCGINDISALKHVELSIRQSKSEAETANHAKTVFLATMSHEIRTPLFGILGTLEMLNLTATNDQQRQYLETIQESSSTLLRTINDTLDLSSIETGHLTLAPSPFNVVDLLESVVSSYAARAESKGLYIYAVANVNTPTKVVGDLIRIRQILNNLVSNAIKFTSSGRIVLRVETLHHEGASATLKFQVTDTGSGISREHHSHLFDPYYRAGTDQAKTVLGTGLGLSICSRLADMMGGQLIAVSEPGLGTSMSLEITLAMVTYPSREAPIRLDPKPIFVQGAIGEIVNNLCHWLRHHGALAMPYRAQSQKHHNDAVLLEAWPHAAAAIAWTGPRVVAYPRGTQPRLSGVNSIWLANTYSLASIFNVVRQAQDGARISMTLEPKTVQKSLDMHLLVVEDNPVSLQILREQLEHLGGTVALATNGIEALDRSDILEFDAILTDLQMPKMDGYDLTQALRGQGYTRPILGITASAFTDDLRRSAVAGMDTVLLKPLSIATLGQALYSLKEVS